MEVRQGRRRFRPAVTGLEGRQLLSGSGASGATVTTIASFGGKQAGIVDGVAMDAQGDLFGSAAASVEDGSRPDGTVFEIPAGTNKVTTLATFNGAMGDGLSGVTLDARGDLFAESAQDGGAGDQGRVFEIAQGSKKVTPLATFDGANGQFPAGGLTLDSRGNLYGTTAQGFTGGGSAFEIPAGSKVPVTLAGFTDPGASPEGVVVDGQGNLFGVNATGGANGAATIFEIARGSGAVTTLATFGGLNGSGVSHLTTDAQGDLFGTTEDGGTYGDGSVFEVAHGSAAAVTLASFDGAVGTVPDASVGVKLDAQGNLYGVTAFGGTNNQGTVFEVAQGSGQVTTLASFTNIQGAMVSGLTPDGPGAFYGTTDGGGHDGGGSVFKIALTSPPATVLNSPGAAGPITVVQKSATVVKK